VDGDLLDEANTAVQRRLFASGRAVVGRTRHHGRVALKFTLVNPTTTLDDLVRLADEIATEGRAWLAEHVAQHGASDPPMPAVGHPIHGNVAVATSAGESIPLSSPSGDPPPKAAP
jgi:hypothetical protein